MFGEHAGFIIPSYVISAVAIVGMILVIRRAYASRLKELRSLEEAGKLRRSEEKL